MDSVVVVVSAVALLIGRTLPDIDLAPVLPLRHRSAWTHGPLLPLAAWWAAQQWPAWWWPAVALCAGLAVHMIEDMWPRRWRGAALVNCYPLPYTMPPLMSWGWLLTGVAACALVWRL